MKNTGVYGCQAYYSTYMSSEFLMFSKQCLFCILVGRGIYLPILIGVYLVMLTCKHDRVDITQPEPIIYLSISQYNKPDSLHYFSA